MVLLSSNPFVPFCVVITVIAVNVQIGFDEMNRRIEIEGYGPISEFTLCESVG